MRVPIYGLEESWLYKELIRKGEIEAARRISTRLGHDRFGAPSADVEQALNGIRVSGLLEAMAVRAYG